VGWSSTEINGLAKQRSAELAKVPRAFQSAREEAEIARTLLFPRGTKLNPGNSESASWIVECFPATRNEIPARESKLRLARSQFRGLRSLARLRRSSIRLAGSEIRLARTSVRLVVSEIRLAVSRLRL